jgi:CBS domain-containing protein
MLLVLNAEGVVMARLNLSVLESDDDAVVDALMGEAPTTVRPSEELGPLVERMRRADVDGILVTSSDGRLRGLLERHRAERAIEETP